MDNFSPCYAFTVPERKRIRLIIDTDAKNEADDQFAIVHALLTPRFNIQGIIGAHFGTEKSPASMQDSYEEVVNLMDLMEMQGAVPVLHGSPRALEEDFESVQSEGSARIIREALRQDGQPLFCIFLGPLTDMAAALLAEPKIANRMTVVWIGGGAWPKGGEEYNLQNDIRAANVVFESDVALWQIPRNIYSRMKVSLAELQAKVQPCGKIGGYLFARTIAVNEKYADNQSWPPGESWVLGDSAAVGVLLDEHAYGYDLLRAPHIDDDMNYVHGKRTRKIRVYHTMDARFILEDFYSKLAMFGQRDRGQ